MPRLLSLCVLLLIPLAVLADNPKPAPPAQPKYQPADPKHPEPDVINTEKPGLEPISPEAALKKITLPEGFNVTLFAGEPAVRQPIAMQVDNRGRLWVAECYSYPTWKETGFDRLMIYEDTKGTGTFDKRTVFWDKGNYLTGFALGYGGVYVCCAPHLLFIPDRNGDDVPDGPPEVLLEGWSTKGIHNVINSLSWGPDGWLYGCNGITAPSKVGKPGSTDSEKQEINCGIWRFHPVRKEFEVVAHGTTNPWGLDWNDTGEAFFTNCVIGHLWHLIPGAHYQRMFGSDVNPYSYGLLPACSDHLHWTGTDWTKARGGKGEQDKPGGGHAHSGCLIELGDNFPESYRNSLFTCNIHGNRINNDSPQRQGNGYVGKHAADFLYANDTWFRGVSLVSGPDGGVYVCDWSDTEECHDRETHRTSGRIYKVVYGKPKPQSDLNLAKLSDLELVKLQANKNEWFVRHARCLLQERATSSKLAPEAVAALRIMLQTETEAPKQLRALWALYCVGAMNESQLLPLLESPHEAVRSWAIQLICESKKPSSEALAKFTALAKDDKSGLVRLHLASSAQRIPLADRWPLVENLVQHEEDATDRDQPLMLWYAIEPLVVADRNKSLALISKAKIPLVRQYIAKRNTQK